MKTSGEGRTRPTPLQKAPTGIRGLDQVTRGGLPRERPTLVCGGPGCGKTLMAMEFLVHGACDYREPGVFVSFEETVEDLVQNFTSLGFDLRRLAAARKLAFDYVHIDRNDIEESGDYDLEGLFVRLGHAIDAIKAKRVVLDSIESLFAGLSNHAILRAELRRLFLWLKARGTTAVITGERGEGTLTRFGIEEYVSDCVIVLDHRVTDEICTRRLRIVKYRGSMHGTNEYPFLVDDRGITVLPVTSLGLAHPAPRERIATGIPLLDTMLGGKGFYRGSSILVSGPAGSGKTSVAAHFADAACRRGERCLYFLLEESPAQLLRNMRSIGLRLEPWIRQGLLQCHAARPSLYGLEMHLAATLRCIEEFRPHVVIVDPITSFTGGGTPLDVHSMLLRLIDSLKGSAVTALLTSVTHRGGQEEPSAHVSSLIDTWLLLRDRAVDGARGRTMFVLKSRGMAHSHQIRDFAITNAGVEIAALPPAAAGATSTAPEVPSSGTTRDRRRRRRGGDVASGPAPSSRARGRARRRERVTPPPLTSP